MDELSNKDELSYFEGLFTSHFQLLVAKAFQVCNNWQMAEDATQDFFADVWRNKSWKKVTKNFTAYACKGVQYKTISLLRKGDNSVNFAPLNEDLMAGDDLGSNLLEEELKLEMKMIDALNSLPAQRKEAFLLAHYYNKTYSEISVQMGVSINTVKTHLRLAVSQLRKMAYNFFFFF